MSKTVIFGNSAPTQPVKVRPDETETVQVELDGGSRETVMVFPDDMSLVEILQNVTSTWGRDHSLEDPEWVKSDNALLQAALANAFERTVEGEVKGWKGERVLPPLAGGSFEYDELVGLYRPTVHDPLFADLVSGFVRNARFLRTSAGADFQSRVMGDTASTGTGSYASATFIALTANATAPAAGSTTLTGEIVTAGFTRAQAAYAHTAAASTYTLTKTFTAQAADVPVTVAKIGVFNAVTVGTLVFETLLSATAPVTATGDQVQVTETVTI